MDEGYSMCRLATALIGRRTSFRLCVSEFHPRIRVIEVFKQRARYSTKPSLCTCRWDKLVLFD
jgi:hypothetical protein